MSKLSSKEVKLQLFFIYFFKQRWVWVYDECITTLYGMVWHSLHSPYSLCCCYEIPQQALSDEVHNFCRSRKKKFYLLSKPNPAERLSLTLAYNSHLHYSHSIPFLTFSFSLNASWHTKIVERGNLVTFPEKTLVLKVKFKKKLKLFDTFQEGEKEGLDKKKRIRQGP